MKSAVLSRDADSICISWILHSFGASTCFTVARCLSLGLSRPHFSRACLSATFCLSVYLPPHIPGSLLCLGLWAGFWQGLLWLSLPQASKGKERDRLCHIMRALLSWLWLRVVIQNWCGEEPALTSCQRWMFSTGRQASGNDNVGYAPWALTTPFTLWHTWWYLTHCHCLKEISGRHVLNFSCI